MPTIPKRKIPDPDQQVAELLGRLVSFWGFRRNLGRLWAVLYLSPEPLGAAELVDRLGMSTGAVSMALNDLLDWGVIRRREVSGVRRDLYEAEEDLWKMISGVLRQREWHELEEANDALTQAEQALAKSHEPGPLTRYRRIRELRQLLTAFHDGLSLVLDLETPDEVLELLNDPDDLDWPDEH